MGIQRRHGKCCGIKEKFRKSASQGKSVDGFTSFVILLSDEAEIFR